MIATGGGIPIYYDVHYMGKDFRLDVGFESIIKRLDSIEKKKRPLFEDMTKAQSLFNERKPIYERQAQYVIGSLRSVITPFVESYNTSAYAQYSIRSTDRKGLTQKLESAKIPYAVHYPIPLHLQEVVTKLYPYKRGDFPISEMVSEEILSLPFSPFLTKEEQLSVIKAVNG